jgi:hypothetical protein
VQFHASHVSFGSWAVKSTLGAVPWFFFLPRFFAKTVGDEDSALRNNTRHGAQQR